MKIIDYNEKFNTFNISFDSFPHFNKVQIFSTIIKPVNLVLTFLSRITKIVLFHFRK